MSCGLAQEAPTTTNVTCVRGCVSAVCCDVTRQGVEHYLCLAQMRKRLGDKPVTGKCGTCGNRFE